MRLIMIPSALAISQPALSRQLYTPISCHQVAWWFEAAPPNASRSALENLHALYPECARGDTALVPARFTPSTAQAGRLDLVQAALNINFGMAIWVALAIHAVVVEWYLHVDARRAKSKNT